MVVDTKDRPAAGARTRALRVPGQRYPMAALNFYRSAVGKKMVMAVTGLILLGFVFIHMLGNLKVYLGAEDINAYGAWLRTVGHPALPDKVALWAARLVLIGAVVLHIHAAVSLTVLNRKARPVGYHSKRDYVAANYAARTMKYSGIIVIAFIIYHLLHFTYGTVHPDFVEGDVYHNMVEGFSQVPVSIVYIVANLLLGLHIYHGSWSFLQTLGFRGARSFFWQRVFPVAFTAVIVLGNISFPIAVMTGVVD